MGFAKGRGSNNLTTTSNQPKQMQLLPNVRRIHLRRIIISTMAMDAMILASIRKLYRIAVHIPVSSCLVCLRSLIFTDYEIHINILFFFSAIHVRIASLFTCRQPSTYRKYTCVYLPCQSNHRIVTIAICTESIVGVNG